MGGLPVQAKNAFLSILKKEINPGTRERRLNPCNKEDSLFFAGLQPVQQEKACKQSITKKFIF